MVRVRRLATKHATSCHTSHALRSAAVKRTCQPKQVLVAQVSHESPAPLPGGYAVGEQVYLTAAGEAFENGDRLVHGEQGEVVGPAHESLRGKGVEVRFPDNKSTFNCYLYQVRRKSRHAATRSSPPPHSCPSYQLITRYEWALR